MKNVLTQGQQTILKRLRRRARRWGGNILQVSKEAFEALELSPAPFTSWDIGVDHEKKTVFFSDPGMPSTDREFGINMIHEMAHTFACPTPPYETNDEFRFFGWEMALTLKVGFTLDEFWTVNGDYSVTSNGDEVRYLTPVARQNLYLDRISDATHHGLLRNGVPVSIR